MSKKYKINFRTIVEVMSHGIEDEILANAMAEDETVTEEKEDTE